MRTNLTKAKLDQGEVVFGGIINRYSPDLIEILGLIGYDFVMIDCEHGPSDLDQVEHMVRAAEVFNITPIARVPDHSETTVLRFLDRGVQGIIAPHVDTREEAESVALASKYYPDGHRGVGIARAHDYGISTTLNESKSWVNSQTMVLPTIEDVEGVKNLDQILTVPGIDVLLVAANDLGQSMGNASTAEVLALMRQVVPRIRAAGVNVGFGGNSPADAAVVAEFIKLGANFITVTAWGLFRLGGLDFLRLVKEELGTAT